MDDLRDGSAGCDPLPHDYINDREEYQQLQSSYDAGRWECRDMSSEYIVLSAVYDGPQPVVSTRPDEYSVASARYDGWISVYIGRWTRYHRRRRNYDLCS
jgi:hypothetical protein